MFGVWEVKYNLQLRQLKILVSIITELPQRTTRLLVTGRRQVEIKTYRKSSCGEIYNDRTGTIPRNSYLGKQPNPQKVLVELCRLNQNGFQVSDFLILTYLIWESYLINYTFQTHDPGILSLTMHEYFRANVKKGVVCGNGKIHSKNLHK